MDSFRDIHRWVDQYYRIKRGKVEHVRAHWWPRRASSLIRPDHNIRG